MSVLLPRRGFLGLFGAFLAAPAVVQAQNPMPLTAFVTELHACIPPHAFYRWVALNKDLIDRISGDIIIDIGLAATEESCFTQLKIQRAASGALAVVTNGDANLIMQRPDGSKYFLPYQRGVRGEPCDLECLDWEPESDLGPHLDPDMDDLWES